MKREISKPGENKSKIVASIPAACSDETAAVEFFELMRWGGEPAPCPHCGECNTYKMADAATGERNKRFLWRCHACKLQFSVRIGCVLEDSRIPLRHWAYAFWRACTSKKGVAALEIKRQTGLSYKSALFLMHRIRFAMAPEPTGKLSGVVEVDEAYVGGKPRYKGPHSKRGRGTSKQPVLGLVERGGDVRCRVIPNVTGDTLKAAVREHVESSSRVMTDELSAYSGLAPEFASHETVAHSAKEYARGDVSTNSIESFFAILKRGITGVYHHVSKKHLHRYLAEFEFRYNGRKLEDGERVQRAIAGAQGKRLMYRTPVGA